MAGSVGRHKPGTRRREHLAGRRIHARANHDSKTYLIAKLTLVLSLIALALTLPMVPWGFKALAAARYAFVPDPPQWILSAWLTAPFLGILSLVLGAVSRRRIRRSSGRLTGLGIVANAKAIVWSAAVLWTFPALAGLSQAGAP
jgi:hypothetical protein